MIPGYRLRVSFFIGVVFPGLMMLAGQPRAVFGQVVINWSDFEPCRRCELRSRKVLSIGEADGPGMIESEVARVVTEPGRGYIVHGQGRSGGTRFSVFDERGTFVRSIGRSGDGPGELRGIVDVAFTRSGRIVVLDYTRRRWITFSEKGELYAESPLVDLQPGRFRIIDGDTIAVVAAIDRRPRAAGHPLHVVDLRNGEVLRHFGAESRAWSIAEPYGSAQNLEVGGRINESVWTGRVGRPHLEEWSADGSHLRTVTGDLEFFPVAQVPPRDNPGAPPPVAMTAFTVDRQDRLWMLTSVPNAHWRAVARAGPEGAVPSSQTDRYRDTRLDVIDLRTQRHLGHRVWDASGIHLVRRDDGILLSIIEYETSTWPRLVLYEVDIPDNRQQRR